MAIDFDAIRGKLNNLTKKAASRNTRWKPSGEHTIRLVPVQNEPDPFRELYFYYFLDVPGGVVAPGPTYGKPDPIAELADKLRNEGSDESRAQAKLLSPKLRVFAPVAVRGEEEFGVRWWGFGRQVYEKILKIILDDDYQDITDPLNGHDLKITFSRGSGATFPTTDVVPRPKQTKLSDSAETAKNMLNNVPDINNVFELKTYEELESLVNNWLSSTNEPENEASTSAGFNEIDSAFESLLSDD